MTVRHTLSGVVGLGTSMRGFRDVKVYVVLKYRELTDLQKVVKHFVPKRNETSHEAHLSFFRKCLITDLTSDYTLNIEMSKSSSGVDNERCLILQVTRLMKSFDRPQVIECQL